MGDHFGRRIEETLEFSRRLVESLSSRFTKRDPERWSIQPEGESFAVRPIARGEKGPDHTLVRRCVTMPVLMMLLLAAPAWAQPRPSS